MSLTLDELLAEVAFAPSVTPADQDPRLGKHVGPYEIKKRLGRGGMGTVYLARDTRLERDVALKMLHDESPLACRELLREARRAATVSHPSIAQVFDVNEEPPPYIAMELVEGELLHELITKNPPKPVESLRILSDTTDAIAVLHAHGIVHRDLTPRNIALTAYGGLKILDFGIAMPVERSGDPAESESIQRAGTERYVAPERAEGVAPSVKEDVFSIGVLASDLFAKKPPPRAVAALLARCRSADSAERPSDLKALAGELRAAQAQTKAKRTTSLVTVFSILAGLFSYSLLARPATTEDETNHIEVPPDRRPADTEPIRLTFYAEDQFIQNLSGSGDTFFVTDVLGVSRFNASNQSERFSLPEGFHATSAHQVRLGSLMVGLSNNERDAYLYTADTWTRVPIPSQTTAVSVAHDGRHIAIVEANGFRITTFDSERPSLLESETDLRFQVDRGFIGQSLSWSPDGQRVMFMSAAENRRRRLEELNVVTGNRRALFDSTQLVGRLGTYAYTHVDDETIAFSMDESDDSSVGIYVMSIATTDEPRLVARVPTAIEDLIWCPTRNSFRYVAYAPDHTVYLRGLSDSEPQRMTYSDHLDWVTSFSSDGEDIHFSRMTPNGHEAFSVSRASPSSEVPVVLSSDDSLPRPSRAIHQGHDAWLAFLPREGDMYELVQTTPNRISSLRLVEASLDTWRHAPPFGTQVREGGGQVFFGNRIDTTLQISVLEDTELDERFSVTDATSLSWFVFAVSQDGERIAYRDPMGITLTNAAGNVTQRIPSDDSEVLQSAGFLLDGSLVVTAGSESRFRLLHMNVETGDTQTLASSYHRWFAGVATSPTRNEFAYTSVGCDTDVFELTLSL